MTAENTPEQEIKSAHDGVPVDLIKDLHGANERFHRAREHMEEAIDAETNVQHKRDEASNEIEGAEVELEKLDEKIGEEIKKKKT